jgi:Flp pilus assembly protein TadD
VVEILSTEAAKLLASLGMLGLSRGAFEPAETVFKALSRARPEQEIGPIGEGLSLLARGDARGAVSRLRQAPTTDGASLFLAMAYAQIGEQDEVRDILENLFASDNPSVRQLARQMFRDGSSVNA